jgi:hypothetical protein
MSRKYRLVTLTVALSLVAAFAFAAPAAQASAPKVGRITVMQPRLNWTGRRSAAETEALRRQPAAGTPIADFSQSINDGGTNFNYTMIGKNPFVVQAHPSTSIKTYVQPIKFHFVTGDEWDPSVADSCDPGASALQRTQVSPIFVSKGWKFGGTPVGKAQYVDAFQRAMFYDQTNGTTGINPKYHVKLGLVTLPVKTINVPAASSALGTIPCGNGKLGAVEINYWDNLVQTTLLPQMAAQGLTLKDFPLFLFGNVVMYDTVTTNCCILGYHWAKGSGATFQSYGNAMYDNSKVFTGSGDISVLTHEVSEWMADPNGLNPTKPWGHIGQVSGCQNNLETGDPLSGTVKNVVMGGFTYHVQELAFYSWFYHQNPSQGVNGWFSNFGAFTIDANPCP